jgi:HEAT repeat protein
MLAGGKPVSHWVQALTDADPRLRKTAAFKLGNVGAADPAVLPALCKALADPNAVVRREVIMAVVKCGAGAHEALPALEDLRQRDPDATVRDYAQRALEKMETPRTD